MGIISPAQQPLFASWQRAGDNRRITSTHNSGAAMDDIEQMAATIHRHRDEDHDKIRAMMATLRVADAVDVLNSVPSLEEAAEVLTLLPLDRSIEICDQPTLQ